MSRETCRKLCDARGERSEPGPEDSGEAAPQGRSLLPAESEETGRKGYPVV